MGTESEARRKALLNRLHRRTADEVKEEEELLEVLQRIDQQLHKAQKVQEQPIPAITASTPSTGKKDNSAEGREEEVDDNECEAGEAGGDYESEEPMLKRIKTKKTAWTKPFMRSQMQYFPKPTKETEVELELEYGVKAVAVPTERSVNKYLELRSIVQKKQELERLVKQKEELVSLLKPNLARLSRELEATKKKRKAEEERKTLTSAKPITFCGVGASQPQDTTAAATTVVPKIN